MPKTSEREYRSMPVMAACGDEKTYRVEGYATTFNDPYTLFKIDGIEYKEQIDRNAFDGCDMSDVIMQFDHQGRVFARTRNNTLKLSFDDHGMKVEADLSSTENSRSLWEDINAGLIDRMSFAFTVAENKYDRENHLDTITKIGKLYDVSAVSIPANPGTDISAKRMQMLNGEIEREQAERLAADERARKARILEMRVRLNDLRCK